MNSPKLNSVAARVYSEAAATAAWGPIAARVPPYVTPKVVEIDSNPGLTFYELYLTESVPQLTGLEPDPMLKRTKARPGRHDVSSDLLSA